MFKVDDRILSSSVLIQEDILSSVFLKNTREFPWLILVPRVENVSEIHDLCEADQILLTQEIARWSSVMNEIYQPQKMNIANLGNMVSQLHVHLVARFEYDSLWPHGIWQAALKTSPYEELELQKSLETFSSIKNQR
jgi:diadenosine tetraphosphate (Ap4A) HIT family hydrolase